MGAEDEITLIGFESGAIPLASELLAAQRQGMLNRILPSWRLMIETLRREKSEAIQEAIPMYRTKRELENHLRALSESLSPYGFAHSGGRIYSNCTRLEDCLKHPLDVVSFMPDVKIKLPGTISVGVTTRVPVSLKSSGDDYWNELCMRVDYPTRASYSEKNTMAGSGPLEITVFTEMPHKRTPIATAKREAATIVLQTIAATEATLHAIQEKPMDRVFMQERWEGILAVCHPYLS